MTSEAYVGDSGMTSPNTAEPAAGAEPPEALSPRSAATGTGNRLAWLDVLRGLAALAVVFNHFGYFVPTQLKGPVNQWIDPGAYGVFVFFILLAVCSMTYLLVERPMQDLGRRLARRLDVRFGPDRSPVRMRAPEPALAHNSRSAE
jgi:peptidoglycan/LPS O-acetylase OafA/YrhL